MLLKFLHRDKPQALPAPVTPSANNIIQPPQTYPILSAKALLAPRVAAINRIEELVGIPAGHFQQFYLATLNQYACFVQLLPASEAHHHAHAGGLLDHTLEALITALALRQGYLLPPGAAIESLVHLKDVWTYAVFAATLCHDLAKPAVDQRVSLYDVQGQSLGHWDPWRGDMGGHPEAYGYGIEFVRNRTYRLHEKAALLLVNRMLPGAGLTWLASDRQVFSAWLACVSGDVSQADVLGEIVGLADRQSVAHNLGAEVGPQAVQSSVIPLHDKLVMALRHLIEEQILPLNRNGAAGWRTGNQLWLVSKRTVDSIRLYLSQSGHTGIPTDNQRLFDILQEHQILTPCQDRAIWRNTVQGDHWAHELTLLCIPLIKLWPHPEAWPEEFRGRVIPKPDGSDDTVLEAAAVEQDPATLQVNSSASASEPTLDDVPESHPLQKPSPKNKPKITKKQPVILDIAPAHEFQVDNLGGQFLNWVITGLQNRSLDYNNPGTRVHVVAEGVLLVSPGIFQDYVQQRHITESWEVVQKKFLKLGIHERNDDGLNVHQYRIAGKHHRANIMAILLTDRSLLFKTGMPSPNPHVVKV